MTTLTANPKTSLAEALTQLRGQVERLPEIRKTAPAGTELVRFEFTITPDQGFQPVHWLAAQTSLPKIFWRDRGGEFTACSIGQAQQIKNDGAIPHSVIIKRIRQTLSTLTLPARFYGGLAFDPGYPGKEWQEFGSYRFILPRFELTQSPRQTTLAGHFPLTDDPRVIAGLLKEIDDLKTISQDLDHSLGKSCTRRDQPDKKTWMENLAQILPLLSGPRYKKIVLARRTTFAFQQQLDPYLLLNRLQELSENCFLFLFQFNNDQAFLGASPERLYRRENRAIETEAIAGTRRRGQSAIEDRQLCQDLINSAKDQEEHHLVLTDLKSQLAQLCRQHTWPTQPEILSLKNSHHLMTKLNAQLAAEKGDAELLAALHPTPAVAGTPTGWALGEIQQREEFSRGWYAGPVGYVGTNNSEFAVAIRCGLIDRCTLNLYAGAGIVKDSQPQEEWQEIEHKLNNFVSLFSS